MVSSSKTSALKALTVEIEVIVRSIWVAAVAVVERSEENKGTESIWERNCMMVRNGTVERMTRVRGQERVTARRRQALTCCGWRDGTDVVDFAEDRQSMNRNCGNRRTYVVNLALRPAVSEATNQAISLRKTAS